MFIERHGQLEGVVSDLALLARLLPGYVLEDPTLAQVLEEGAADLLWQRLEGHTAAELLPTKRAEVAQVDGDATLMEIAAAMVRARAPLVAVRDRDGRLLGGITTSRLLTPPAGRPMSATLAVAIFLGAYGLIATEKVNRVTVALTGAGLLLALRVVSSADAFHSERYGIDWDVIFLLLGTATLIGDPPNIIIASQAYLAGARLLELFPVVPIMGNITLDVGVLSYAGERAASAATSSPCCTGDPLSTGPCGGGCLLGALPLEDQLVVLGGAERGHAWSEDLHEPPAVPRMLMHDILVAVPRLVADAEQRRTPIFSEPNKLVLIELTHRIPFP